MRLRPEQHLAHEPREPLSDTERERLLESERNAHAAAETALAALAKIEARFRSIVETTTEWMWACDLEGRHTYSNQAVESILGYRADEVLTDAFELMHPDDREHVLAVFREGVEKKTGWSGLVVRWRHRDGSYRFLESNGVPIVGPSGELEGFRGSDRDVTARMEAKEKLRAAEERYRNLVEELPIVMYVRSLDTASANIYASPQVEDMLGYPVEVWETDPGLLARIVHPDDRERVLAEGARTRSTGEPMRSEYRCIARDGRIVWVQDEMRIARDENGEPSHVQGFLLDITERRVAEEAVGDSEERFRTLVAHIPGAIYRCIHDEQGWRTEFISSQIEDISGYAAEEFYGENPVTLNDLLHPDDAERVVEAFENAAREGQAYTIEYRLIHRDGSVRWVVERARGMPRSDGTRLLDGAIFDVTEQRAAQRALRVSEERFRTLVSNIPGAIYRCACDSDWTMEFVSEEVETITGYPPSDFLSRVRSFASVIHPEDRGEVERAVLEGVREKRSFVLEYRVVTADGGVRWVYEKGQGVFGPDGEALWIDGAIFDVTERKQIEQDLAAQNERLLEAEELTHLGSWSWDVAANSVTWSDEMFRIWGLDPERFGASYEAYLETVHPEDRAFVETQVQKALLTGGFDYECRIVRRDGSERLIHARAKVLYDEQGAPLTMIGTTLDITERRQAEEARHAAEEKYRTLVEYLPLVTYVDRIDEKSSAIFMSPQIESILGYSVDEWTSDEDRFMKVLHPDDRERVLAEIRHANETDEPFSCEYRLIARDGRVVWFQDKAVHEFDESGRAVYARGYMMDITERKEIEAERERLLAQERAQNARLRELDRLKDTFVASVSHELRTPLTSISGFLQLMQDGLAGETTEEQRRCLAIAGRNAERLHRLIGDLLFVAQMDAGQLTLEPTFVDLRVLAEECLESVRPRAMQAGVEVVLEGDGAAALQGDPSRLTQLLDNLVSNAIKFSSEGEQVAVRTTSENGNVVLEVADQGIGIPADQQRHLFQRFFRGSNAAERAIQGTGIGLSIVKAIVDAHGGSIAVESREGAGTTFRIAFPVKLPAVAPRSERVKTV